jgi:transposase-like protein
VGTLRRFARLAGAGRAGRRDRGGRDANGWATRSARLERPLPKIAALLEQAEEDSLAFYAFPAEHWRKLRSTNPLRHQV